MSSQSGRLALQQVVEQGWKQLQHTLLEQLKKTIEGLLAAERDRRVAQCRERGEKIYRWGYTVRKCWQTAWGKLEQVRVPRLRGQEEVGAFGEIPAARPGGSVVRLDGRWVEPTQGGELGKALYGWASVAGPDRGSAARCPRTDSKTAGTTLTVLGSIAPWPWMESI